MSADLVELMDEFHQQGGLTEECAEEGIRVLQKFTFNFTRCDKFPYYQSGEDDHLVIGRSLVQDLTAVGSVLLAWLRGCGNCGRCGRILHQ